MLPGFLPRGLPPLRFIGKVVVVDVEVVADCGSGNNSGCGGPDSLSGSRSCEGGGGE